MAQYLRSTDLNSGRCVQWPSDGVHQAEAAAHWDCGRGKSGVALFAPVCPRHLDLTILATSPDVHAPRVAAHLTVLNERAAGIGFDVDLHLLATVRAGDEEVIHLMQNAEFRIQNSDDVPARPADVMSAF